MIHDLYLDTPDRELQAQELALRIREIGARRWVTLKGQSQPTGWDSMERLEIEMRWSKDALARVVKELADRGIRVRQQRQDFDYAHPLDVMAALGLEAVQDRESCRQVRNIIPGGEEGPSILAELAIDSVVYHFSDQEIHHHEVEIEEKEGGSPALIKPVVEGLVAMYGPALRRWGHSKLAVGKALERMLREGALEGLLDTNNNLKPFAYDKIDDYLKRSSV